MASAIQRQCNQETVQELLRFVDEWKVERQRAHERRVEKQRALQKSKNKKRKMTKYNDDDDCGTIPTMRTVVCAACVCY